MPKQKFNRGDLVHIAKDLGKSMSHFPCDLDAYIDHSYADNYGMGRTETFALLVKHPDRLRFSAWYDESQLTLVAKRTMKSIRIVEKYNRQN